LGFIFLKVAFYVSTIQHKMVNTQAFICILIEKNSSKIKGHME